MLNTEIELYPIGFVEKSDGHSKIVVNGEFEDALEQIEQFNCLVILYWLHKVDDRSVLKIKPRFRDTPVLGVFATRFPARPNPIGISTVELVERSGNALIVKGLDAENGTPVIDIKPYIPIYDEPKVEVELPHWVVKHLKLHKRKKHPHTYEEVLKLVRIVKRCVK